MDSIPSMYGRYRKRAENSASRDPTAYDKSSGGGYYVSISIKIYCIDIRKFFLPYGETDVKRIWQGIEASHCDFVNGTK